MKSLKDRLGAETQDEKLTDLRDKVKRLVKMSRNKMSKRYHLWDQQAAAYNGERLPDLEDEKDRADGKPEKIVVPMGYAQVETYVAFAYLLLTQNKNFYELLPTGGEDHRSGADGEKTLERDLRRNQWNTQLSQFLRNTGRFGLGVVKHWWVKEMQKAPQTLAVQNQEVNGFNFAEPEQSSVQDFVKYEGNRLDVISPYNFFPDTRFPLAKWKKGSFVADETEWHINDLKEREREGSVHGVKFITPMTDKEFSERGVTRLSRFAKYMDQSKKDEAEQIVCVTECQLSIVPSEYEVGEETYPVKYVVELANDERVLNVQPLNYLHDEWTYDVGQYSSDMHEQLGRSITDMIEPMQDVDNFLVNSRLHSVKKSMANNLIVDPMSVDMASLESNSPWILMDKGSPSLGVDKFVRQLQFTDVTQNHFADVEMIGKLAQMTTGINDGMMGQAQTGRRSATEMRNVTSGAASRLKVSVIVLWDDCFAPLGRKLLLNQRQALSIDSFIKILGPAAASRYAQFHPQNLGDLVGTEDHFVFDSTLTSEKGFLAQSLQELVTAIVSNPLVMQSLPLNVGMMMEEVLRLRGIDNLERFRIQPQLPPNQIPQNDPTTTIQRPQSANPFTNP